MSALRIIAIILSLSIISTTSAPSGIEFGIRSKVYYGSDRGVDVPLPTVQLKWPGLNPLNIPFGMPNVESKGVQQPQFIVPPQAMDMMMAFLKPAFDSGLANKMLQPAMG